MTDNYYDQITLLVTHYNRSNSLLRLLKSFKDLHISFADIVISDDGSNENHMAQLLALQSQYNFNLVTASNNMGLGNNINKGQSEVKTALTLYVQEDFVPLLEFRTALSDAAQLIESDKKLDIIRFFSNLSYPYAKPYKNDFSELYTPFMAKDYRKIYSYSDNPHLRRSSFLEKFGRYKEGIESDRMEYWMCLSFIQKRGKALLHNKFKSLFDHINTEDEPSMVHRVEWKQKSNFALNIIRDIYRQIKYNWDILFSKS